MSISQTNDNGGRIGVVFIDVLFAIVMGISATEILGEPWYKQGPTFVWQSSFGFEMGVLLLGYATLITSWVGYHRSVGTIPQEIGTFSQWVTFVIDILLLACYLLILTKFKDFGFVLVMLFLVFGLYVIWDIFHQRQRTSSDAESRQRMGVSRFWAVYFALLLVAYCLLELKDAIQVTVDWGFLSLAFAGIVLYRLHKKCLRLKSILDLLMFQRP